MRHRDGERPAAEAVPLQKGFADVARRKVPLDDGELHKVGVFEHYVAVLCLDGDDFPLRNEGVRQEWSSHAPCRSGC